MRWRAELAALGYRDPGAPVELRSTPVGALDRDAVVERMLTRLAAGRSAWNAADLRGEAERLIAAEDIVADAAVRIELAEDLTARALARCIPLLAGGGVPEHVRAWTFPAVLAVEADLAARLAARGTHHGRNADLRPDLWNGMERLDAGQAATAAALAGPRPLVVVEGAAGAGKTTTLTATRELLAHQGRGLLVVTPTLKAAKVAAAEVGTAAGSAAWLAFEHGWRWSSDGAWTRLALGDVGPATGVPYAGPRETAQLAVGDLLVVDEAGMLDQDTARALLPVADEVGARLALIGDRNQLTAVGCGGVLDLAAGQVDPTAHLVLDAVHRFVRTDQAGQTAPDVEYAQLTLAMRTGEEPGAVFDALMARGAIRLHADPAELQEALAAMAATHHHEGERVAVVPTPASRPPSWAPPSGSGWSPTAASTMSGSRSPAPGSASGSGIGSPPVATTATSGWPTAISGPSTPSATAVVWRSSRTTSPRPTPSRPVSPRRRRGSGCCPPATSPRT